MLKFEKVNVNPKGRKTGDCSTRAIVGTLGISYDEALRRQCEFAIKTCYGITNKEVIEAILKQEGWVKMKQPRKSDGSKYTVGELDAILPPAVRDRAVLVTVANHHTCIVGDAVQDIWDCRKKTVGNYYIRGDLKEYVE